MASAASARARKVSGREEKEIRSNGFLGKNP